MRFRSVTIVLLIVSILAALLVPAVLSQEDDCTETLVGDGTISGEWAAGCDSSTPAPKPGDGTRYARFYTFTLEESSQVTITLESSDADTYLYLREGETKAGTALHLNDDDGSIERSWIQEILDDGTYTIEATTYSNGDTGNFTLTVSGITEEETRSNRVLVAEPGPGHFHHDTDRFDSGAVYHSLNADIYDAAVSGWFENPHGADANAFSYGFVLRSNANGTPISFMAYSNRQWRLIIGDTVHSGTASGLRTAEFQENHLSIAVIGKLAAVSLNGTLLANSDGDVVFHVGSETISGDVLVRGAGQDGTITHYDSVVVYEIIPDYLIADGLEASELSGEISLETTSKGDIFDGLELSIPEP